MMKTILPIALLVLSCHSPKASWEGGTDGAMASEEPSVLVEARTDRRKYSGNELIELTFRMTNVGKEDVHLAAARPSVVQQYRMEVLADGRPVPATRWGERHLSVIRGSLRSVILRPAESMVLSVPLNRMFDMTRGGTYRVVIGRVILGQRGSRPRVVYAEPFVLEVSEDSILREDWER